MLALQPLSSSPGALSRLKWLQLDLGRPRAVIWFLRAVLEKESSVLVASARSVDLKGAWLVGRLGMGHQAERREAVASWFPGYHSQFPMLHFWYLFKMVETAIGCTMLVFCFCFLNENKDETIGVLIM